MGNTKDTTTQTTTLPGMGTQEAGARAALAELAGATGQLGDLSALASGQLQLSPSDVALLNQIQELTGQSSRAEMQRNLDFATGDLEETLLARGVEGSSIEGLEQGLLRTEALRGLNESTIQGQIGFAQGAQQMPFQRAGLQLNANQLLLNRILQGAGQLGTLGLQERMAQGTTTQETEQSGLGAITGQLGQLAGMAMGAINPIGAGIGAVSGVFGGGGGAQVQGSSAADYRNLPQMPGTGATAGDYSLIGRT